MPELIHCEMQCRGSLHYHGLIVDEMSFMSFTYMCAIDDKLRSMRDSQSYVHLYMNR